MPDEARKMLEGKAAARCSSSSSSSAFRARARPRCCSWRRSRASQGWSGCRTWSFSNQRAVPNSRLPGARALLSPLGQVEGAAVLYETSLPECPHATRRAWDQMTIEASAARSGRVRLGLDSCQTTGTGAPKWLPGHRPPPRHVRSCCPGNTYRPHPRSIRVTWSNRWTTQIVPLPGSKATATG